MSQPAGPASAPLPVWRRLLVRCWRVKTWFLDRPALSIVTFCAVLLLVALYSQVVEGYAPCPLCLQQRWAHAGALLPALIALWLPDGGGRRRAALVGLSGVALFVGVWIAGHHVGVEQAWWEGSATCSNVMSIDDLRASLTDGGPITAPARCTEISWTFAGLSMAAWNAILSAIAGAYAVWAAWRLWRGERVVPDRFRLGASEVAA